jgi:hypothetical protein
MEVCITCLSISCLLLTVIVAVLSGSVPFLWWKCWKLEQKIEVLDEALAGLLDAAGVNKGE